MKDVFISYLFLYLIERDFQKLISSSLEENDGITFNSMTDRSGKDRTDAFIKHSKHSQITVVLICDFSKGLYNRSFRKGSRKERREIQVLRQWGLTETTDRRREGSRTRSTHTQQSGVVFTKRNPATSAINCFHWVKNKSKGTQLKNLTHEMWRRLISHDGVKCPRFLFKYNVFGKL